MPRCDWPHRENHARQVRLLCRSVEPDRSYNVKAMTGATDLCPNLLPKAARWRSV